MSGCYCSRLQNTFPRWCCKPMRSWGCGTAAEWSLSVCAAARPCRCPPDCGARACKRRRQQRAGGRAGARGQRLCGQASGGGCGGAEAVRVWAEHPRAPQPALEAGRREPVLQPCAPCLLATQREVRGRLRVYWRTTASPGGRTAGACATTVRALLACNPEGGQG